MTKPAPPTTVLLSFESLKQSNEHGAEYWSARDLHSLLGYSQWRHFEQAIERAKPHAKFLATIQHTILPASAK
jgi:hypothetical protein